MHYTKHLRHWQWTCLWSDVQFWTLLKHFALWHLHWFYNSNIVILYVNVDCKMWDTSSHLVLWCKHCVIVCIHLSWKWGHICTNGFAMYGLLSIIETFRFDMFVLEGKLRQCDSNILCFDIWIRIHDANIVFSHVNVFCLFGDTSSHMVLQCMESNQELIHWDLTC